MCLGARARIVRHAVRIAYDGTRFSGSQSQPGVRTVHGEVARALATLGEPERALRWAGRTDAGVSARGNVVVFESGLPRETLCASLTFAMEDAWAWAIAPVHDAFEPRHARERHYRYFLRSALDAGDLERALHPFVGEHDFTSFARVESGVNPVRRVTSARVTRNGPTLRIDITGESFLWNQVRRMVEAARRVAAGDVDAKLVEAALVSGAPQDFGTAAPEGLVLMDVRYDGLAWELAPHRIMDRLRRSIEAEALALDVARATLGDP
jgi:tRNA pseudouridine38-40 synthase